MSAIVSLLRVMTLRDAEAITLEAGKVPTLRRRGQVEALAMPALEPSWLEDFATPLLAGKPPADGPQMVAFVDEDGATYPVTIERMPAGYRLVVRRGAKRGAGPTAVATKPAGHGAPTSGIAGRGGHDGDGNERTAAARSPCSGLRSKSDPGDGVGR